MANSNAAAARDRAVRRQRRTQRLRFIGMFSASLPMFAALILVGFAKFHPEPKRWIHWGSLCLPVFAPVLHLRRILPHSVEEALGNYLLQVLIRPERPFDPAEAPAPPRYEEDESWGALWPRADMGDIELGGEREKQSEAEVDVFYLAPTVFFSADNWNAPMEDVFIRHLEDQAMIFEHASIFNTAARVYSPRYREATAASYLDEENGKQAFELAFSDVKKAFQSFLFRVGGKRPFAIVGHSQGTIHARRLLAEVLDVEAKKRLVAAYLIGSPVLPEQLPLPVCELPRQTNCVIAFQTFVEGGNPDLFLNPGKKIWLFPNATGRSVCVNPLSWRTDEKPVVPEKNPGSFPLLHPELHFRTALALPEWGDAVTNTKKGLAVPVPGLVGGWCRNGTLWIEEPRVSWWQNLLYPEWNFATFPGGNYHAYDYNLYFLSIRRNFEERVRAFLELRRTDLPGTLKA